MDKGVARSDGSHRATALALMEQALGLLDEDDSVPEVCPRFTMNAWRRACPPTESTLATATRRVPSGEIACR